jgi:hypothetical protein
MKKFYCATGSKFNLQSNNNYYREIAYALADRGFILRVFPTNGLSKEMIKGVEKFATNRKIPLEDILEVYIHTGKLGNYIDDLKFTTNVTKLINYKTSLEITNQHSKQSLIDYPSEQKILSTIPYLCLGKELKQPVNMLITDEKKIVFNNKGKIIDSIGSSGQGIRILNTLSPETEIFSYDFPEHKQRMNKLVYLAKK